MKNAKLFLLCLLSSFFIVGQGWATDFNAIYEASSGAFPENACPPWQSGDSAKPEDPVLTGGKLIISTSERSEDMAYSQRTPNISPPDPWIIETRVKFVSGTSCSQRAPIFIRFTASPNVGNAFYIDKDEIFLNTVGDVKGPRAFVDTNGDFHTYRIEISATGYIQVFYDGVLKLTGSTFFNSTLNGAFAEITWGEFSGCALGTSEWESFKHNASTVQCEVADPPVNICDDLLFECSNNLEICNNNLASCQTDLAQALADLEQANQTILDQQTQIDNLTSQVASLTSQIADLNAQIATLEAQLVAKDLVIAERDSEIVALMAERDALIADLVALQAQIDILNATISALQAALAQLSPDFELPGDTPEEQIENLVNAISNLPKGPLKLLIKDLDGM